jgi:hypothetical protein
LGKAQSHCIISNELDNNTLLIKENIAKQKTKTTMGRATGEIYQDRSKGKDVRTSNIVSAKVNSIFSVMLDGQPRYYVSSSLTGIV